MFKKKIALSLILLLGVNNMNSFGTTSKVFAKDNKASEQEEYIDTLQEMVELYDIEEEVLVINTDNESVYVDNKETSLSAELGISREDEKGIINSNEKVEEVLENYGYTIISESDDIVEAKSKFASGRIYVDSPSVKNNYGAVLEANSEHTILQYDTTEQAAIAYEKIKEDGYTVIPSLTISLENIDTEELEVNTEMINGEYIDNGIQLLGIDKMQEGDEFKKRDVKVAVIDTGVNDFFNRDIQYINLSGSSTDKDTNGHGTKVASVIADCTSDNVDLVSIKVFDDNNTTDLATIESALLKCIKLDVDVINISIGMFDSNFKEKCGLLGYWDDEFKILKQQGKVVCVSAGNEGVHTDYVYPAGSEYVWTISAISPSGEVAAFSNYGKVDFSAKGVNVICKNVSNKKVFVNGTSFASPYISGLVANYKGKADTPVDTIYDLVMKSCIDLGKEGKDEIFGYGYPSYKKEEFKPCEHKVTKEFTKEATCSEDGYIVTICSDCNEELNRTVIEAKEHQYEVIEEAKANCITKGSITYKCKICGNTYQETTEIDSENHVSIEIKRTKEPACGEKGEEQSYCSACDTLLGSPTDVAKLEHIWTTVNETNGDCINNGTVTKKCELCKAEETVVATTDSTIHNKTKIKERVASESTCTKEGIMEIYCENCNTVLNTKSIPVKEHSYKVTNETKGSCSTRAVKTYKCEVCDSTYDEKGEFNSEIHNIVEQKKDSTCSEYGYIKEICSDCGRVIKTTTIKKKEHTLIKDKGVTRCSVCNETFATEKYTLTLEPGGAVLEKTSYTIGYGETVSLPVPTKEGYTFIGWYDSNNKKYDAISITKNTSLKAKWSRQEYTITFDTNGGRCDVKTLNMAAGDKIKLPSVERTGYVFEGWFNGETKVNDNDIFDYNKSVTFTAKWTKITITEPKITRATVQTLTVAKVDNACGYQVYISSNTTFNPKKAYSNTKEVINVSPMAKGTTYIAIRSVGKDSAGNYIYSNWKYYKY